MVRHDDLAQELEVVAVLGGLAPLAHEPGHPAVRRQVGLARARARAHEREREREKERGTVRYGTVQYGTVKYGKLW